MLVGRCSPWGCVFVAMRLVNIHERTNKRDVPDPDTQVWFTVKHVIKFPIFLHFIGPSIWNPPNSAHCKLVHIIVTPSLLASRKHSRGIQCSPHGCHCGQTWSKESTCKPVCLHLIYKRLSEALVNITSVSCSCQACSCLKSNLPSRGFHGPLLWY